MKPSTLRSSLLITSLTLVTFVAHAGDPKAVVHDADLPETTTARTMFPIPDYTGDLANRAALSGDWGGARTSLAKNNGIQFETKVSNYYQGVISGGTNDDWEYSGIAEYVFKFDSNQAGLWPGGFLFARGETFFGRGVNGNTGALLAANTHFALRLPADVGTYLPHIYYTQFVHEKAAIMFGKLDTLTGDMNSIAHVMGHNRFMNLGFNLNPLLLKGVPYSPLGAGILLLPSDKLILKFIALDTEGAINHSGFDTVFNGGTTYLAEANLKTNFFKQPGHQNIIGVYTDQKGNAVQQDPRIFLPRNSIKPNKTSESWAIAYNFEQYLISSPDRPGKGVGLFGRAGVSDGKANLMEHFLSTGIGGTSLIPSRENDRFGVGYYYLGLAGGRANLALGDSEQGVEIFYNIVPTPWCDLTINLQVIDPAVNNVDTATVLGFRGSISF